MKRILVFYSHFAPAFKAGGPVQSLINMVSQLQGDYQFFVVCDAYDVGDSTILSNIKSDSWNDYNSSTKVFYASKNKVSVIHKLFYEIDPDIVYVNGVFLPVYNWLPLWLGIKQKRKVVLAPRGMFQQGALSIKPFKKKIFLSLFKILKIPARLVWHATDNQEKKDIVKLFGTQSTVLLVPNVSKVPMSAPISREKKVGELKLVYLSLITEKKNLGLLLKAIHLIKMQVSLDIYGPINDPEYWKFCQSLMIGHHHIIRYCGVLSPDKVQKTLALYHAFVLPTKGENFGHAIYEAFSVGTPAILSAFTPWGRLQDVEAGLTLDALQEKDCADAIESFLKLDQKNFDRLSNGAHQAGKHYYYDNDFKGLYRRIFS